MFDLRQLTGTGRRQRAMPPTPAMRGRCCRNGSARPPSSSMRTTRRSRLQGARRARLCRSPEARTAGYRRADLGDRGNHGQSSLSPRDAMGAGDDLCASGNSVEKNVRSAFGADLVEHGEDFQAAREEANVTRRDGLSSCRRSIPIW